MAHPTVVILPGKALSQHWYCHYLKTSLKFSILVCFFKVVSWLGIVIHAFNPSTPEAEEGGSFKREASLVYI